MIIDKLKKSNSFKINMSSVSSMSSVEAIRLVSLPAQLQVSYDVVDFIRDTMPEVNEVTYVNIVQMKTATGVPYRTAFAAVEWIDESQTDASQSIQDKLARGDDVRLDTKKCRCAITFDNGKPMDYVKVVAAKTPWPSTNTLALPEGSWLYLFIPVVPQDLSLVHGDVKICDEDALADFLECELTLGKVTTIELNDVPGKKYKSAIVHFDHWYDNQLAKSVRHFIDSKSEFTCKGFYNGFEQVRFDNGRYISLLRFEEKANPPVGISSMIMSMMVREQKIRELEAEVKALKEENAQLREGR
jgi:hypothetical protein